MNLLQQADVLAGRDRQREEHARQRAIFEQARDAIAGLGKVLNGEGRKGEEALLAGLLEGLTKEHRYLQDQTIWLLLRALGSFGGLPDRFTDARNEHAHKACRDVRGALADRIFWGAYDVSGE